MIRFITISGRFLSRIYRFAKVPGMARNSNDCVEFVGEEPIPFPSFLTRIRVLSPNVLRWAETPGIVGYFAWFLIEDYRV